MDLALLFCDIEKRTFNDLQRLPGLQNLMMLRSNQLMSFFHITFINFLNLLICDDANVEKTDKI